MEKYLRAIGVTVDDESTKDSKDTGKRSQASMSKAKEKEASYIKSLTHLPNSLTIESVELKQRTSEIIVSSKPPKYPSKKNEASGSS